MMPRIYNRFYISSLHSFLVRFTDCDCPLNRTTARICYFPVQFWYAALLHSSCRRFFSHVTFLILIPFGNFRKQSKFITVTRLLMAHLSLSPFLHMINFFLSQELYPLLIPSQYGGVSLYHFLHHR